MRYIFSTFLIVLFTLQGNAQVPFIPLSFNTDTSEAAYQFCESPSGRRYLFLAGRQHPDSSLLVFLSDNYGTVLKSRFLDTTIRVTISCTRADDDTSFCLYGYVYPRAYDTQARLFFCRIDTNLNILEQKETPILERQLAPYRVAFFSSVAKGGNVFTTIDYTINEIDSSTGPPYRYKRYQKWVKQNGKGDTVKTVSAPRAWWNSYLIASGARADELVFFNNEEEEERKVIKIDTNLEYVNSTPVLQKNIGEPDKITDTLLLNTRFHQVVEVHPDIVFVGTRYYHLGTGLRAVGINRYNMQSKRLESINSFPPVKEAYASFAAGQPGLIKHNNTIYHASTLEGPTNRITVAKHDSTGKCAWIRYIKVETIRVGVGCIFGTSDGGLLIFAITDTVISSGVDNKDMYIIKLNEDGYPVSISNASEQLRSGIVLYPNPAQTTISFKGVVPGNRVQLYNVAGQLLMQEDITQTGQHIAVSPLPPGTYNYTILDASGTRLSSGQWVKQ